MKKNCLIFFFTTTLSVALAQTQETEIIYRGMGKIVLEDGTMKEGEVYHSRVNQRRVAFKAGDMEETFKTKELKEFYINDLHFVKVQTAAVGVNEPEFAILKTAANAKVKIYEVCFQHNIGTSSGGSDPVYTTYREYYAQFPSMEKIKPLGDVSFMPFAKKVSKMVESCPSLFKKIADKEDGYSIGLVTPDEKKLEIFSRIAEDFENCNQ